MVIKGVPFFNFDGTTNRSGDAYAKDCQISFAAGELPITAEFGSNIVGTACNFVIQNNQVLADIDISSKYLQAKIAAGVEINPDLIRNNVITGDVKVCALGATMHHVDSRIKSVEYYIKPDKIVLLYAKSASGKDWYVREKGWNQVVSHTTRQPRPNEIHGKDKWFDKIADYLLAKEDDSVVAETNIQGNQYWTTEVDFEGKDVFIVDIKGIIYLMDKYKEDFVDKFSVMYLCTPGYKRLYRIIKRDGWKKGWARFISDRQTFSSDLFDELHERLKYWCIDQVVTKG